MISLDSGGSFIEQSGKPYTVGPDLEETSMNSQRVKLNEVYLIHSEDTIKEINNS